MKKLFTFIAAALMSFAGIHAQSVLDIPLEGWGWGYNSESSYADGILTGTLTGDYGAISTGWDPETDWSSYDKLTVVIESYNNDWGKVTFKGGEYDDNNPIAETSFSKIDKTTKVEVSFDPEKAKVVKQLSIQGKAKGDVIKISKVFLSKSTPSTRKQLAFDTNFLPLSEFVDYDDSYDVEIEIINESGESRSGWGIGAIGCADDFKGPLAMMGGAGDEFTLKYTIAQFKETAKKDGEYVTDQYNRQGLTFNVYNDCKIKAIYVIIPEGENSGDDTTSDGTPIVVWEGEQDMGTSWSSFTVPAAKFAEAKEGKAPILEITFTQNQKAEGDNNQWVVKTLYNGADGWTTLTSNAADLNDWGCVVVEGEGQTTYSFALNDEDIKQLKTGGLILQGYAITITKITVTNPKDDEDGISSTIVAPANENAAIYNLAGQKVDASYKGVVIKNGKKFFQK